MSSSDDKPIWIYVDYSNIWQAAKELMARKSKYIPDEDHRVRINIHELINIIAHGRPVAGGFLFGVSGLPPQWKIVGWTMKNQTAAQVSADIFQKASDTPVERRSTIVVVSGNSDLEPGINTLEEGWKFEIYSWEHTLAAALSILRTENVLVHYLDQYLPQITYISREFKGDSANISDSVTKRVVFYMIPGCEPSEEWCREVENVTRWPFQYYWSSAAANNLVLVFRDSASFDIKTFLENVNKHPLSGMRNAELYHDSDEKEKRLCPNAFCCIYGVRCRKIHTDKENDFFRKNGGIGKDLRKVKPCNHYIENYGWCKYTKEDCNFAHGEEDAFCPNCGENGHYQEKCEYARKPFMAGNAYYNSTTQSKSQEPEVQAEDHKEQKDTLETQQMDDTQRHIATTVRMMKEKGSLNLRTLHLILHGLPAAGKTCAKLRLTGQELTCRKPAERRDGKLIYLPDDGAHSTPVAEEITRARLPASATAITREADNLPWYLLQSLDEEMVGLAEKISKLSSETKQDIDGDADASPNPVSTSSRTISLPVLEPINNALDKMITSAFKTAPQNSLQDILKETLIYLIDSGGQPQFQELLPVLVSGPSVFLLTFSLAVPLDAVYEVHFTDKDGKREDYPTNMRVRDVLTQSLASIRCTCSYQTNGEKRVEVKPRVIFMATMRSLVSDEEIAAVNKQLNSLVEPFSDLIVYNGSRVLFPIDSFTGEGISTLRTAVRNTADDEITKVTGGVSYTSPMCEVKLPTTAVALELLLRNQEKGIISLDQCKRLAIDCNIDLETELPHVLWLLHHYTGSIRYYPEDSILCRYVVTSPQKLYDIPSTLLNHTFAFKKEGEPDYVSKKKVWTRGVFTKGTLRKLWGKNQDLTPELIFAFLVHLNIIVQMHDEESEEEPFFMPSALICARAPDDCVDAKISVDSALVCFNGGYSSKGVFSSVIAYLPKDREENEPVDLKWYLPPIVGSLCCNQATLVVSVNDDFDLLVKLTVHLKFIEIAVNSESGEDPVSPAQLQLGCEAILHDVSHTVQVVSKSLHYNSNATLKDGIFFPCYCSNDPSTHAVKYLPSKKKGKCHGRSAQPDQHWMNKWNKDTGGSNLHEQWSASSSMARESHTAVTTCTSQLPTAASGDHFRTLIEDDLSDVLAVIHDFNEWKKLGLQLGLLYSSLQRINLEQYGNISNCKIEMLSAWLQRQDNVSMKGVPSWSVLKAAMQSMGEHKIADRISN